MHIRTTLAATLAASLITAWLPGQAQQAPCWESNQGASLGTGDDIVFAAVPLGFTFVYGGQSYTDVRVGTNGLVYLGNPGTPASGCCSGTGTGFVAAVNPYISALWTDLNIIPANNASVRFNTFPAGPGNNPPARAVVTWINAVEFGTTAQFSLQLQLLDGGGITMAWGPGTAITNRTSVIGVSPGNNATNPGSQDFSTIMPFTSNGVPTIYEEFANGTFDLAGRSVEFIPDTQGGYILLDRTGCQYTVPGSFSTVGVGCPAASGSPNPEFYEFFTGGAMDLANTSFEMLPNGLGYTVIPSTAPWVNPTNQITMTDDQTIQTALPFAFPRPGGTTNTVGHCSNGYLWLDNSSTGADFSPTVAEFLSQGARLAPYWVDHNPATGGAVYSDVSATSALFSWVNVPLYANAGATQTWQVQLFPTGIIQVRYQTLMPATNTSLTGFSRGGNVPDPGSMDLSAAIPGTFSTGVGTVPATLAAASGNPAIGSTFQMRVGNLPQSSIATFLVLGLTPVTLDLTPLGATGCTQYQTADSTAFYLATPPAHNVGIGIPNNAALIGMVVNAQAATFAPGINTLGVITTNGGVITVGTF